MDESTISTGDDSMPGSPEVGVIPLDLITVKKELVEKSQECKERGLIHTFKWLSEIRFALRSTKLNPSDLSYTSPDLDNESDIFELAKGYFDLKEYDRSAFFTQSCKHPRNVFIHFYSRYLSGEKKRLESMTDAMKVADQIQLAYLKDLRAELQKVYERGSMDGYLLYLYGVVLKNLSLVSESQSVLIEAVHKEPCHWSAWQELAFHISDRASLLSLQLPDHWVKHLFLAHTYLELQLNEQALEIYFGLQAGGLQDSTYILAQVAIAFHNMREVDQAVQYFRQLAEIDPYRLDNLDTYSNLLYVKEQRVELAHLAQKTVNIDKYRTETCCVVGNYYSLRSQHEKAVQYFQRALKLNPNYLSAWTLMGHEFMELKNTNAAIDCYRKAIKVNRRDYRAWYGLGQTYEILKMFFYCLYYYKKAHELRPNDSRMLVALGESYEKLNKLPEALKCYWKAHCVGDIEGGIAVYQLARMYELTEEPDQAAGAYHLYVVDAEERGAGDRDQQSKAYCFLAQYHLKKGHLDEAYNFAQKCTEFVDTKNEGKTFLKEIAQRRQSSDEQNHISIGKDDDLDDDKVRLSLRGPAEEGFSPAVDQSARKELEPINLSFE